jgi:hypothetical protein
MDLDRYLHQVELLDCSGRVSHTLTLLPDGLVRVDFATGRRATVDPRTRRNLTPHVPVGAALLDRAAQLRPW